MIYGELGITPIAIDIQARALNFWCKLTEYNDNPKLSADIYKTVYAMHCNGQIKSDWLNSIQNLLNSLGFSGVWQAQKCNNINWLKKALKLKLKDQYIQKWSSLNNTVSSSGTNYRLFKTEFERSHYFELIPESMSKRLFRFRTRNHRLPIECGRWTGIPLQDRKCPFCVSDIGDEYHYLLTCIHFSEQRKQFIKPFYCRKPNILKYNDLMNSKNKRELQNLCNFIAIIMRNVR